MKEECYDYEIGRDTAGMPILGRRCYCGTTACMNYGSKSFDIQLPVGKFPFQINIENRPINPDCDCPMEWTYVDPNFSCEKCKQRMNKGYEKIFGKGIL